MTNGFLDDIPVEQAGRFENELLEFMRTRRSGIGEKIRSTGKLEDDQIEELQAAVEEFKASFVREVGTVETVAAEEGVPEAAGSPSAAPGDEGGKG